MSEYPYLKPCRVLITDIVRNDGRVPGLPANPRSWTDSDVDRIAKSLQETPELLEARPLLLYPYDGVLICLGGNLRYEGSRKVGWENVPAWIFPPDTPAEKLKEIVIKDNGSFGAWDMPKLKDDWGDLPLFDWGISEFAKPKDEDEQDPPVKDDNFDERIEKVDTRCKSGDLWLLGDHRLHCGDSADHECVKVLMGGGLGDLLLTDPPYNVDVENSSGMKIMNNKLSDGVFRKLLFDAFSAAEKYLRPGAACYVWMASSEIDSCIEAFEKAGLLYKQMLIWVKNHFTLGRQDYQWRHENCVYGWKPGASHYFVDSRKESTVYEDRPDIEKMTKSEAKALLKKIFDDDDLATTVLKYDKPAFNSEHPTMKPLPMIGYLIRNSSRRGDIVLDTFGGSGSTLMACEQLHRKCYINELDPHYCDVILARWEKYTGKKAEKIN